MNQEDIATIAAVESACNGPKAMEPEGLEGLHEIRQALRLGLDLGFVGVEAFNRCNDLLLVAIARLQDKPK